MSRPIPSRPVPGRPPAGRTAGTEVVYRLYETVDELSSVIENARMRSVATTAGATRWSHEKM